VNRSAVKTFFTFKGIQRLIITFTSPPPVPILSQINPLQKLPSYTTCDILSQINPLQKLPSYATCAYPESDQSTPKTSTLHHLCLSWVRSIHSKTPILHHLCLSWVRSIHSKNSHLTPPVPILSQINPLQKLPSYPPVISWVWSIHSKNSHLTPPVPILSQINPLQKLPNLHHLCLSWVKSIHSKNSHLIYFKSILLSSLHLSLRFPHQNSVPISPIPHTRYMPRPSQRP